MSHVLLSEDADHLHGNIQQRRDFFGWFERCPHIHDDNTLGVTQFPPHLHRNVVHQPAIHQFCAFIFDRCHKTGDGHAGAHGMGKAAAFKDDPLTGTDVSGDERQRQRQFFNHTAADIIAHQLIEEEFDFLTGY